MDRKQFEKKISNNPFVPRNTVVQELLLRDILTFHLLPGSRITESGIAQELGISRSPVKQALMSLAQDDYVEIRNKCYYVAQFNQKEYEEINAFSECIETYAAGEAANHISEKQLEKLYKMAYALGECYQTMREDYENLTFARLLQLEMTFHTYIVRASGNQFIYNLYNDMKYKLFRCRSYLFFVQPDGFRDVVNTDHVFICDIIRMHDPCLASDALRYHLAGSYNAMKQYKLLDKLSDLS